MIILGGIALVVVFASSFVLVDQITKYITDKRQ